MPVALRRPRRARTRRATGGSSRAGSAARRCSACPTTRRSPATATNTVNTLRLWQARAARRVRPPASSTTATTSAPSRRRTTREVISKVLYPNDHDQAGKELRLKQEYFFVACSIARHRPALPEDATTTSTRFAEKVAIQLNDTHPAIAIAELMRVLVDEKRLAWDEAWEHHRRRRSATPTTRCSPRRSRRGRWRCSSGSCRATWRSSTRSTSASCARCMIRFPCDDDARCARMSLIEEGHGEEGAHGAPRGGRLHSVNGVAALHTELLKRDVLPRLRRDVPRAVQQQDQRRHAAALAARSATRASPRSSPTRIGDGWVTDLDQLAQARAARRGRRRSVERVRAR